MKKVGRYAGSSQLRLCLDPPKAQASIPSWRGRPPVLRVGGPEGHACFGGHWAQVYAVTVKAEVDEQTSVLTVVVTQRSFLIGVSQIQMGTKYLGGSYENADSDLGGVGWGPGRALRTCLSNEPQDHTSERLYKLP